MNETLTSTIKAIEAAKREWELTMDCIEDIVIVIDAQDRIVRCNKILTTLTGKDYAELLGKEWRGVLVDNGFAEKVTRSGDTEFFHESGRYYNYGFHYLRDSENTKLSTRVITFQDITELKKFEERLFQAKKDWEEVFDSLTDMVTLHDAEFNIIRSNKAAQKILGLPFLNVGRAKCYEHYHGTEQPPEGCPSCACLKTGVAASFEVFEPHLNMFIEIRSMPRFDGDNRLIGLIHVVRDITERRKMEDRILKHSEFLDTVINSFGYPFYVIDVNDYTVKIANKAASAARAAEGCTCHELTHNSKSPCGCNDHPCPIDIIKQTKKAVTLEHIHYTDGRAGYFEVHGYPIFDHEGNVCQIIEYSIDITDRKKLEEQIAAENELLEEKNRELHTAYMDLKSAQSQLLQQEKMASIGQLAAGVAHEINNPVGFIMSNLGTLQKYVARLDQFIGAQAGAIEELSKSGDREAGDIKNSVRELKSSLKLDYITTDIKNLISESIDGTNRVKKIVQDLKGFSRIDESEYELSDINSGLESTINIVWNELKYKVTLKKEFGGIPVVRCNQGQLNQVFMNLLVNAAHAIPERGEIGVRTWSENGNILISVSDTGCGIPPDNLARIFEPFFTTKEVGKGTGLGLSIAYDIVKKHKGEIMVESEVGKGTKFTIKIPAGN